MSFKVWVIATAMLGLAGIGIGCTLNERDPKTHKMLGRVGNASGQRIEPKRCLVKVWMISRPIRDRAVNDAIWERADDQSIDADTRKQFEDNGLRLAVLDSGLPSEVESLLDEKAQNKIEPAVFDLPDGNNTLINVAETLPSVSVFLKRDGQGIGKDYKEASGYFRTTASHDGPTGIALRVVPEIHHGPVLRRFDSVSNNGVGGNYSPIQFTQKDGQQEETLRDMAATIKVEPGQYVAIGHLPERKGSLGAFLLTHPEEGSDRVSQKLILIEVARSESGEPGSQPKAPADLQPVEPPIMPLHVAKPSKPATDTDAAPGADSK